MIKVINEKENNRSILYVIEVTPFFLFRLLGVKNKEKIILYTLAFGYYNVSNKRKLTMKHPYVKGIIKHIQATALEIENKKINKKIEEVLDKFSDKLKFDSRIF